ncbi:MAG: Holliday junction resolvase RuvX [Oscillospiraceae bacterium]|nr:Holliday junction resolvase RuvX [Oscillospiraceae bacterium]MDD7355098.1 Holliday junction resolvase RuvX [Oscillospiraceae bacterium]MDY3937777.1 Holliday junction resolvase RuvX [Oscillospiraceae bacterium]
MIIMSVDYGDVRTGIAVCDKNEMLASPVKVITETDSETLSDDIANEAVNLKAEMVVVGLPKNMDGSEGFRAEACREFASVLEMKTGIPVHLYDERLTTVSAHNALNLTNTRGKKRKSVIDAVSAVMILEDYMRYRRNSV